jgi:hypothetical protein
VVATNEAESARYLKLAAYQNLALSALRTGEWLRQMSLKLIDITNSWRIAMMHWLNLIMNSALRRGDMCRRIKLKLLDITNWPRIRMMYWPNSIMQSALGRGEMFRRMKPKLLDITNWLPVRIMFSLPCERESGCGK